MKAVGTEGAKVGFTPAADGWHVLVAQEGLNLSVNTNSGKESFMIPFAIEEDSEDNGKRAAFFINTRDENQKPYKSVEKVMGDLLKNMKLEEAFVAKFPNNEVIDPPVIEALKIKLPGTYVQGYLKTTKDLKGNDRTNISQWWPMGSVPPEVKVKEGSVKKDPIKRKEAVENKPAGLDW
jgi:hypothetical protein